jgi:hypothetical protein
MRDETQITDWETGDRLTTRERQNRGALSGTAEGVETEVESSPKMNPAWYLSASN